MDLAIELTIRRLRRRRDIGNTEGLPTIANVSRDITSRHKRLLEPDVIDIIAMMVEAGYLKYTDPINGILSPTSSGFLISAEGGFANKHKKERNLRLAAFSAHIAAVFVAIYYALELCKTWLCH